MASREQVGFICLSHLGNGLSFWLPTLMRRRYPFQGFQIQKVQDTKVADPVTTPNLRPHDLVQTS